MAHFLHYSARCQTTTEKAVVGRVSSCPVRGSNLKQRSLRFTGKGALYRVTCGPLSDNEFARLQRASQMGELVRLVFPHTVVTLSYVTLECPRPGWAQVEGLVLSPLPARQESHTFRIETHRYSLSRRPTPVHLDRAYRYVRLAAEILSIAIRPRVGLVVSEICWVDVRNFGL